ncbi:MAG: hypothetical protein RML32_02510, partial [Gammaproteobacteria bacterium]|nr:hypothetical protein [Gammaproteobacteria bacterium]
MNVAVFGAAIMLAAQASSPALAQSEPNTAERASTLENLAQLDARRLAGDPETWPGAGLYRQHCGFCHEGQVPKAPHKMFLQ